MNVETGAMAQFETDEDAELAGYSPIGKLIKKMPAYGKTEASKEFIEQYMEQLKSETTKQLYGMNRHERRVWASRQRKAK